MSESGREGREKKQERERENESQRRTTTTAARQRQQQTLPPQPPPPLKRLLPHSQRGGGIREQLEQERSSRQRRPSVDDSRRFFLSFRSRRQDSRVSSSRLFFSLFLSLSLSLPPCFSHPISSADPNESKRKRAEKIEHVPKRLLSPLPLSLSLSQKTKKKPKKKSDAPALVRVPQVPRRPVPQRVERGLSPTGRGDGPRVCPLEQLDGEALQGGSQSGGRKGPRVATREQRAAVVGGRFRGQGEARGRGGVCLFAGGGRARDDASCFCC